MKNSVKLKMKKVVTLMLSVLMLCIGISIPVSASEYLYVSGAETGAVYLRTAPASSNYYMTLNNGTLVESIGWARGWDGEGYNQVRINGVTGWITTKYLSSYYYAYNPVRYRRSIVIGVDNSIYLWTTATSSSAFHTINVGNYLYVDYGTYTNGRYMAYHGGVYGWVTAKYVIPW